MTRSSISTLVFLVLLGNAKSQAQTFNNSILNGKYFFVQLLITVNANTGLPTTVSNLGGSITFNGSGTYSYAGNLGTNAAAAANSSGNGSYSVSADGSVAISNPIRSDLTINARISADEEVVLGSTTEDTKDITGDLFVAVKAPAGNVTNGALNGTYYGSTMSLPNGTIQFLSSSVFSLSANGSGQFTSGSVIGHEADQFDANTAQTLSNATYSVSTDGSGTANFGSSATSSLLNGTKNVFISADGNYVIGFSTGAGSRDILLATKMFSASANNGSLNGRYWIAELDYNDFQLNLNSGSGSFVAYGNQSNLLAERLSGAFSASGNYYSLVNANSLGQFTQLAESGLINMGLGAPSSGSNSVANAMVGAQIDLPGYQTTYYGVFFAVTAPTFSGTPGTVYLKPNGVVNDASFAPSPNAIAPGDIAALFGAGLSPVIDTPSTIPLPVNDQGVSVTVNGILVPLFYISPGQINIEIPYQVAGSNSITVQVTNGGAQSNAVTVPLASGDPAIFMWSDSAEPNHAAVLHANGTLVAPANPATRGETIEVFATGLGVLTPAVATNAQNPSSPPALTPDKFVTVLFDGEPASGIPFAGGAPTFIGLNQINVVVPKDATTGSYVPIQIESSWGYSDVANIAIQ